MGENFCDSGSWLADPVSGKKNTDVARYRLSDRQRVPMSLSGKERNHLFISLEGKSFKDVSSVSGADSVQDGRSFAILDYDRDGWQDMVLTNSNGPVVQLFNNQIKTASKGIGNFVALRFVGGNRSDQSSESFSNRDGVGAKIKIELDDKALTGEFSCGEGLAAQNSSTKIFGLGAASHAKSITIVWPQGKVQQVEGIRSGELVTFYEDETESKDGTGVSRSSYVKNQNETKSVHNVQNRRYQGLQFTNSKNENASTKLNIYVSMATWCPSCKKHLPELTQLRSMFDRSELGMIGVPVSDRDDAEKLEQYAAEHQPPYELTDSWTSDQLFKFFKLAVSETRKEVLPSTIITDAKGDVLEIMQGLPSASDIIRLMAD